MARPSSSRPGSTGRPSRRSVLAAGAAAGLAAGLGLAHRAFGEDPPAELPPMPRRPLGRMGFEASVLGLGCFYLGSLPDEAVAVGLIVQAIDGGCNYLDTAPSYAKSERRVGIALRERPDAKVFVATKTHTRTESEARRDVEGSLRNLGREHLDLVQVHAVKDEDDLQRALAPEGPLKALVKAREEGLVRHIGVSGHYDPAVMCKAIEAWPFESLLCPLNCVDPHSRSFVKETLPKAVAKGISRVAMKVYASGNLPQRGVDPEKCLRFSQALDVSTVIVGCRTKAEVTLALRVSREARPLDEKERGALLESTAPHQGPDVEWYKRR